MYVTFAEAVSWLGLLAGMIAKYGFDNDQGVAIMGPIHGTLLIAFGLVLLLVHVQYRWPVRKTFVAFLEAVPPFTGFLLGKQVLGEVRAEQAGNVRPA